MDSTTSPPPWRSSSTRACATSPARIGELALEAHKSADSNAAVAEMYINGVSTRKVTEVVEELSGFPITSTQVSRTAVKLDEERVAQQPVEECSSRDKAIFVDAAVAERAESQSSISQRAAKVQAGRGAAD